jgi:dipeptide transport system ATP-binding protein
MALLEIRNLRVEFDTARGQLQAVDGIDIDVEPGEVIGIVGESGSGKSVAMLAVMGLIRRPGRVTADRLAFDGADLLALTPRARRRLVGKEMAMIFQEPMTSLNPCFTVGWQIGEALAVHLGLNRRERRERTLALLRQVGIPAPEQRISAFPHQLSGGLSQRVMIAMAIACKPRLLIADEPTTALDVTIQKQILDLLRELQREYGMALILITHDMAVVGDTAKRVQVMYAGEIVESRPVEALMQRPAHPYTAALLDAMPERAGDHRRLATIPGIVPGIADRPRGCLFSPRCRFATDHARQVRPGLTALPDGVVRCHQPLDAPGRSGAAA